MHVMYLSGQNAIIVVSGANMLLGIEELAKAESMIASAKVAVFQIEISPETTLAGMKLARKHRGEASSPGVTFRD